MSEWTFHNVNRRPSPGAYKDGKYWSARDLTKRIDKLEEVGLKALDLATETFASYRRQKAAHAEDVLESIRDDIAIQAVMRKKDEQIRVLINALGAGRMIQLTRARPDLFAIKEQSWIP